MKLSPWLWIGVGVSAQTVSEPIASSPQAPTLSTDHADHCATLGFDVYALDCRLCTDLTTFLTSAATIDADSSKIKSVKNVGQECQKCCSDFARVVAAEDRRYAKAVLAVSHYRLKRYPTVASFVEHHASAIKGLEVQETAYRLPTLQFFDTNGVKMEEIRWVNNCYF